MKVGIFGGTFNPIHYGHLRAAIEVQERMGLDRVLFVPAGEPPLKSTSIADARHRKKMVELAVAGNPFFEVSAVECEGRTGKSYSVETLGILGRENPGWDMHFIIGADAFRELHNWREPDRLLRMARFVVINRPPHVFAELLGSPYIERESESALLALDSGETARADAFLADGATAHMLRLDTLPISSTDIRKRLASGRAVTYLLPRSVESYIIAEQLYIAGPTEDDSSRLNEEKTRQ